MMTSRGIPRPQAERQARHECGIPEPIVTSGLVQVIGEPLTFPIRLTLPWSALCSDNDRKRPIIVMIGGKPFPRMAMTAEYKLARGKVVEIGRKVMSGFPALAMPLGIYARVWVPDERLHDVVNFAKGVHDALEKIVYVNDKWLHRSLWERQGVDVDAPRAEIEIAPLSAGCQ